MQLSTFSAVCVPSLEADELGQSREVPERLAWRTGLDTKSFFIDGLELSGNMTAMSITLFMLFCS